MTWLRHLSEPICTNVGIVKSEWSYNILCPIQDPFIYMDAGTSGIKGETGVPRENLRPLGNILTNFLPLGSVSCVKPFAPFCTSLTFYWKPVKPILNCMRGTVIRKRCFIPLSRRGSGFIPCPIPSKIEIFIIIVLTISSFLVFFIKVKLTRQIQNCFIFELTV